MLRFLANFFSGVFHPMLMPTIGFALFMAGNPYLFSNHSQEMLTFELVKVFLHTFFFPAFTVLLLVALRFASSIDLPRREERIIPFVASGFFYLWAYYVYYRTGQEPVFQAILLGATASIFIALIINVVWLKISIHASGVGGLVAMSILVATTSSHNLTWAVIVALLIAGLVGSSRLYLKAHTHRELLAGYALGVISQAGAYVWGGLL